MNYKVASIFTGVGGFELGLSDRFQVVLHADFDPDASAVLKHHYPHVPNLGDLEKVVWEEQPDFDILVGGAPCQAFSEAGKRMGFNDTRGTMFFEYARVLKEKKPKYFVFENVKGLITHDKSHTIGTMFHIFKELGYSFDFELLRANNFGPPQARDRIFIVGVRNDCVHETYRRIENRCAGKLQLNSATDLQTKYEKYTDDKQSFGRQSGLEVPYTRPTYRGNADMSVGYVYSQKDSKERDRSLIAYSKSTRKYHVDHRIRIDGIANTLNTGDGCRTQSSVNYIFDHSDQSLRKITPLEAERIQGWPDNWTAYGNYDGQVRKITDKLRYKLVGNGVVPQVVQSVMEGVF